MGAPAGDSSVSEDVSSVLGSEVTGEIRAAAAVTTSGDNWGRAVTNGDCATPVTSVRVLQGLLFQQIIWEGLLDIRGLLVSNNLCLVQSGGSGPYTIRRASP